MSFLDEPKKPKESEKPKEPSFFDKTIDYFKSGKFGEALSFQVQSGGPSGAPSMTPKIGKKVAAEVGTIAAVEAAFIPVVGAAAASQVAPGILTALAGLTQAGVTGSAIDATTKLVEEGEFPSKEEMLEHGLTWMAIDALLRTLHVGYNFGAAVRKIAKEEGIPATKVLNNLWTATKNYAKDKFGRIIKGPQDVSPEDVEILIDEAKRLENKYEPTEIDITPKQKAVEFEKKPEIEYQPKEKNIEDLKKEYKDIQDKTDKAIQKFEGQGFDYVTTPLNQLPEEIQENIKEAEKANKEIGNKVVNDLKKIIPKEILDETLGIFGISKHTFSPAEQVEKIPDYFKDYRKTKEILRRLAFEFLYEDQKLGIETIEDIQRVNPNALIKAKELYDKIGDYFNVKKPIEIKEEIEGVFGKEITQLEQKSENFTTSKGSVYQVNEDGSTIRTKAARPEHPGEEGLQPKSEKTWYITPEDSVKLGEFQAQGTKKSLNCRMVN